MKSEDFFKWQFYRIKMQDVGGDLAYVRQEMSRMSNKDLSAAGLAKRSELSKKFDEMDADYKKFKELVSKIEEKYIK